MDILKSPVGSHHNSGSGGGGGGGSGYPEAAFEDGLLDLGVPVQVQSFLWRQIAPFIRPKLGKLHEASCMVSGPPVPHGRQWASLAAATLVLLRSCCGCFPFAKFPVIESRKMYMANWSQEKGGCPEWDSCSVMFLINFLDELLS